MGRERDEGSGRGRKPRGRHKAESSRGLTQSLGGHLRGVRVGPSCLGCAEPVGTRYARQGWVHPRCEEASLRSPGQFGQLAEATETHGTLAPEQVGILLPERDPVPRRSRTLPGGYVP